MAHTFSIWLLVAAFFGAGLLNAIGTPNTQSSFVRWGYPAWWCRVTGALEMADAALIAFPASRQAGLGLGAIIIVAALMTVTRRRDLSHLSRLASSPFCWGWPSLIRESAEGRLTGAM